MLSRRSFLTNVGVAMLAQWLSGCESTQAALKIALLQKSIPPQLLRNFRRQSDRGLSFKPRTELGELFTLLQSLQQQKADSIFSSIRLNPNLVTIGHYWLSQAVSEELIEPLERESLEQWHLLPPRWQELVQRNVPGQPAANGTLWGAPYRWGTTMIAYRRDKFQELDWTPQRWSDLWREELTDRISLPEQPREIIGFTLKKLGYSYNTTNLSEITHLKSELLSLQQQVKFYSSENYLQPLILGDTWLAVGWSTDIIPIAKRYSTIEAVVPEPGTALWADLWVKPKQGKAPSAQEADIANQWIDFCWLPQSANQISLFTTAASPIVLSLDRQALPPDIRNNPLILPQRQLLEDSEFILPLPTEVEQQYQELWQEVISHHSLVSNQ